jgi:hypothetical protein
MSNLLKRLEKLETHMAIDCTCQPSVKVELLSRDACLTDSEWRASLSDKDLAAWEEAESRKPCPKHGSLPLIVILRSMASPHCKRANPEECPDHGPGGRLASGR